MPDVEKVVKGLECCAGQCNYHGCPYKDPCENANGVKQIMLDALSLLKEQPEIVRCKDCEYCYFASNRVPDEQSHACEKHGIDVTPDWFCACGERK